MKGIKHTQEEIQKSILLKFDFIEIVDEYKNSYTKNIFLCKKCNTTFSKTVNGILKSKYPCFTCFKIENKKKTIKNKKRKIDNFKNKEFINGELKFFRFCPDCNKKLYYNDIIYCERAIRDNRICNKCANILSAKNYDNGMKGKSVFDVWEYKYGTDVAIELNNKKKEKTKNTVNKTLSLLTKEEKNEKWGKAGKENPFYGKKHSEETLRKMSEDHIKKGISVGENNPMYGKPSPQGSGNGWSGWYKNIYFRSLLELSYLIYLFENNINFESGENKKHSIKYFNSFKNIEASYFPDFFLIDTKEIIEVKPKNLVYTKQNIDKFNKAKEIHGEKFRVLTEYDINRIDKDSLKNLILNKEVTLLKKYEEKFNEYYNV